MHTEEEDQYSATGKSCPIDGMTHPVEYPVSRPFPLDNHGNRDTEPLQRRRRGQRVWRAERDWLNENAMDEVEIARRKRSRLGDRYGVIMPYP